MCMMLLAELGCQCQGSCFCGETTESPKNKHSVSGQWGTGYNFSLLSWLSSIVTPSKTCREKNRWLQWVLYESRNTHYYINTIYFIHTSCVYAIQCCQTLNVFISKSGFFFIRHLRVISLHVFNRLCSFLSHSKGNWVLIDVACITPFRPFGTFYLGLTHIITKNVGKWNSKLGQGCPVFSM